MKLRVLAFATAGDALGAEETEIELPEGADLAALEELLTARCPALAPLWPRLAVAVEGVIARGNPTLRDGQEVALLPPVSGGSGAEAAALVDGPIAVDELVGAVRSPARGAVTLFLGTVRDRHDGRRVEYLTYAAYRKMALAALRAIAAELTAAGSDLAVAIHHRLGRVPAGEPSVAIVTAAPHREAAYAASRAALERLKREVPIWKKEHFAGGGAAWREEEALAARGASGRRAPGADG
ncbi:MAG: molybdenum cofactor biosynthesis protein MoaE [Acidobacteriota bacterium]|nr:molybdenum cofactor biosynthesis protein MoaE [Acidobacteriota bacterium]MDH3524010.1 molybdenum cofactor biosynthesis protein MoaE [Acidobacteriota bacterium]